MGKNQMRIMGIDPGLETTGVGILEVSGTKYCPVYCGCIKTHKNIPLSERLNEIYSALNELILKYSPKFLAIEDIFFNTNVKTAISIGQARGVSILAGSNNNVRIFEFTPLQVKMAITGYGRATKKQIKYMLKIILGVNENFFSGKKDDAWDAMAVAVCCANSSKLGEVVKKYSE